MPTFIKPALFVFAVVAGQSSNIPDASLAIKYRTAGGITPPLLIQQVAPVYSEDAQKANVHRIVRISFVVGLDGKPESIEVAQPAGLGLDEKTVEALGQWRFKPGMKDGQAVRVEAEVEANFRTRKWRVTRLAYSTPQNAPSPVPKLAFFPLWGETCGEVTVHFQIQTSGVPADLQVLSSTNESMSEAAMEIVGNWRFWPPRQDGSPVARRAEMVLSCEPWLASSK